PPPPPALSPLSLHDALPISRLRAAPFPGLAPRRLEGRIGSGLDGPHLGELGHQLDALRLAAREGGTGLSQAQVAEPDVLQQAQGDRKSTRLNSSHVKISYAV